MKINNLDKIINDITTILRKRYRPQRIILFGSCAWGRVTKDSDIDMLIIKDTDKNPTERWVEVRRLARNFKRHTPFSPLIYTSDEILQRLELGDFFVRDILSRGKVLYEKQ